MSEVLRTSENGKDEYVSKHEAEKRSQELAAEREKAAAEAEKKHQENSIEAIRERIEKAEQHKEAMETARGENAASESAVPLGSNLLSKHMADRKLHQVQKQLPGAEKAFSRVIHAPVVETLSNAGGATVARPSGLLVGGLFSVISSLVVLYICRHYGYEYNFFIGLACFIGGFALGLLLEAIYKIFKRS